ncbi:hypothetical protein FJZ36_16030 [Candidatus Poribacteria bacterium]|nr:hypothetical protein [Candidatus Poribacteria bacterium]
MTFRVRRWSRRVGIASVAAGLWLGLAVVSAAQNLLITDYRVPVSSASALRANLNYDYKKSGSKETENRGSFFADYSYFYDSLRFAYAVDLKATADKTQASDGFTAASNESVKAYIIPRRDLFVGAEFRRSFASGRDAKASAGTSLGYGRFINATPLAKAVRMEDWLLSLDQLTDDLPAETMIELAQIIQREGEFREIHGDTYRQEWFAAMERVIRQSGMMKRAELEAMALLRMEEVLTRERVFDRFIGWEARAGGSLEILPMDAPTGEERRSAQATFQFARPLGWHTQWNERATATSRLGDDFADAYDLTVDSSLSYEMSDRVDLLLSHTLTANRARTDGPASPLDTKVSHRLQGSLIYFLENSLTLNLNGIIQSDEDHLRQSVTLTFGYRFF